MKIAIIGIGAVGAAVATAVAGTGLAHEMVLLDRDGLRARAAAEDLGHAAAFSYDIKITAVNNYRGIRGSDIVIIAAGANQKPGETRTDLLEKNVAVMSDIIPRVMANVDPKHVKLIVVTNQAGAGACHRYGHNAGYGAAAHDIGTQPWCIDARGSCLCPGRTWRQQRRCLGGGQCRRIAAGRFLSPDQEYINCGGAPDNRVSCS